MTDREPHDPGPSLAPLVPVFRGSLFEALSIQSLLESQGIYSFIPSEHMKTIDPFVTGLNAFETQVRVRTPDVPAALQILRDRPEEAPAEGETEGGEDYAAPWDDGESEAESEEDGGSDDGDGDDESEVEISTPTEALGRRLRWGAVVSPIFLVNPHVFVAIFSVYACFFLRFLWLARAAREKPNGYGFTLGAFAAMAAFLALAIAMLKGIYR